MLNTFTVFNVEQLEGLPLSNKAVCSAFDREDYAFAALIAKSESTFPMANLGIVGEAQHDSYLASCLKVLKNDKRYIFKTASAASKAHWY